MVKGLHIFGGLCKVRISLFTTLSALTGYLLACALPGKEAVSLCLGIFLLACGSSALNQYQERDIDACMLRTRNRPLPSRLIEPPQALGLAAGLLFLGAAIMFLSYNRLAVALALTAVILYNGIYTPLKRKTAFAAALGALIGALPPAIGWVTGGGWFLDPQAIALSLLFFIWQVPHSWLLLLDHADDYRQAGLPTLTDHFSRRQVSRMLSLWIFSVAVACLILPLYMPAAPPALLFLQTFIALFFFLTGVRVAAASDRGHVNASLFPRMNLCLLAVMVLLIADRVLISLH